MSLHSCECICVSNLKNICGMKVLKKEVIPIKKNKISALVFVFFKEQILRSSSISLEKNLTSFEMVYLD